MPLTIAHATTDSLPRVVVVTAGTSTLDVLLPFRVDLDDPAWTVTSWELDVEVDGRSWGSRVRTRRLRDGLARSMWDRMTRSGVYTFDHLPYYVNLRDDDIRANRSVYLECRLPAVPAGAAVTYALTITIRRPGGQEATVTSPTWTTHALDTRFTRDDIRRIFTPAAFHADEGWVLYHRRASGLDQFRLDVLDLNGAERADVTIRVGDTVVDLAAGNHPTLPLVDISADSVTFAVPHGDGPLPEVVVRYRGGQTVPVDLDDTVGVGSARLMFVNFAIQGLNDLFATPDDDYRPPRSYCRLTMRDEAASYCSRPGSNETTVGDGYAFTLDAHRRYGVRHMWAMNGGLAHMLHSEGAGDPDLAAMRDDVTKGLLVPVVAGYGAHRLPYYSRATNVDAIRFGARVLETVLGAARPVYYPDQRLTTSKDNVAGALRVAGMDYVVVDAGTDQGAVPDGAEETPGNAAIVHAKPAMGAFDGERWLNWQYVWRDRASGVKVLFIDRELKDHMFDADPGTADRGKPAARIRWKLLEMASAPVAHRRNLLVYSDDADKASGNGWFDGDYGKRDYDPREANNFRYQAVLSWLAAHPWVEVVTTDDLTDDDVVGELDLLRASDPYLHENWPLPNWAPAEKHDNGLVYDSWYAAWAATPAAWLGENLRAVSDRAEQAINLCRPDDPDDTDELLLLARLYFLMCLHESQWSKRPRIEKDEHGAFLEGFDHCENFVAAESLQLRNAHVYLAARHWARWVREGGAGMHRDSGPVVEAVAQAGVPGPVPAWWRADRAGLQWDHDPLTNVVLHNEHALVVADRNGGRITHVFAMVGGRPVSVSGTFKAYQFVDVDWVGDGGIECDGLVLQNTVWSPNHGYVACDVEASRGTIGSRPPNDAGFDLYYPDNFNLYDEAPGNDDPSSVTFVYGPGTGEQPPATLAALERLLADDRDAKIAGERGVVLHDVDEFGAFRKTVTLDGRTLRISYESTEPGHRVANEFCVDLLAAALDGHRQRHTVAADGRSATVTNDDGLEVCLELGPGCRFSDGVTTPADAPTADSLRLHRVLTDDLEIVAPDGGDFSYSIVLPGA
jgi:hypothetical protein